MACIVTFCFSRMECAPVYLNLMTTLQVGSFSAYDWHACGRDMFLVNRREMPNCLVIIVMLTITMRLEASHLFHIHKEHNLSIQYESEHYIYNVL